MGLGALARVIAGIIGIDDAGALWAATAGVIEFSVEELISSELVGVCTVDHLSIDFEFFSESDGAEGELFLSDEPGDKPKITPVLEKSVLVTGFIGSIQYKVSSEIFESEVLIVKDFNLISFLSFIRLQC